MTIRTYTGADAEHAAKSSAPGLYIVQSDDDARFFRIGESDHLLNRTKQHGGKSGLVGYADPNFCEMHRPWIARWIAVLPADQPYARLVCENLLTAEAGSRFAMFAGSSFDVPSGRSEELIGLAESLKGRFEEIYALQSSSTFSKRPYRQQLLDQRG